MSDDGGVSLEELLGEVREGLVVRPGDHLVLSFPNMPAADVDVLRYRAVSNFGPAGIAVDIVVGAEQIAVIRQDEEAFAKRVRDVIRREARLRS